MNHYKNIKHVNKELNYIANMPIIIVHQHWVSQYIRYNLWLMITNYRKFNKG